METYAYTDKEGNQTTNIVEIVSQEVELLAYCYVEKNGKKPSLKLINQWTEIALTKMGWYDDK